MSNHTLNQMMLGEAATNCQQRSHLRGMGRRGSARPGRAMFGVAPNISAPSHEPERGRLAREHLTCSSELRASRPRSCRFRIARREFAGGILTPALSPLRGEGEMCSDAEGGDRPCERAQRAPSPLHGERAGVRGAKGQKAHPAVFISARSAAVSSRPAAALAQHPSPFPCPRAAVGASHTAALRKMRMPETHRSTIDSPICSGSRLGSFLAPTPDWEFVESPRKETEVTRLSQSPLADAKRVSFPGAGNSPPAPRPSPLRPWSFVIRHS
jgi:hypothetical protein